MPALTAPGPVTPLVLAAGALALVYLLRHCTEEGAAGWTRSAIKTGSVALLALAALFTGPMPVALAVALGLCALGDLLLSRPGEGAFLGGVGAFAAGHVAYILLFLTHPAARPGALLAPPALMAGAALAVFAAGMAAVLFRRAGGLRWAVLGYVPVVTGMTFAALALPPSGGLALVPWAALLFLLSDTVLATGLFLMGPGHPLRRAAAWTVWSTYWLAQAGLFAGLGWIALK